MKKSALFGTVTAFALAASGAMAAEGDTLKEVKARGVLNCGVNTGLVGFAAPDANGNWSGFDVAFCKAMAAAVLGDATKVKFVPTTGQTRFTALSSGEVDILARNSTWTFQRDTDLKLDFVGVNYYDGQGFMVRKDLGVTSAKELDGATICIQTGTTTELNLADYFKANNMTYQPVNIDSNAIYRQPKLRDMADPSQDDPREAHAAKWELNYVALDGNIGCMVNGAGLAMGTMDIVNLHGGAPANFLDVGGGATEERVTEAFKIILSDSNVAAVLVNIFGGIVRCDMIAEGIIGAVREVGVKVPVVVRLEGNNADLGAKMLSESGLNIIGANSLTDAAIQVVKAAEGK